MTEAPDPIPPDDDADQVVSRHPADLAELDALFASPQRPRVKVTLGATVVLTLVAAAIVVLVIALQPRSANGMPMLDDLAADVGTDGVPVPTAGAPTGAGGAAATATPSVVVHVLGAVRNPGVYELAATSRVVDAISAAGGVLDDAELAAVNLARTLVDGEQLYVPRIGETPPVSAPDAASGGGASGSANGGLVNLNTATLAELDTLPRIGPALAQRIIDYRTANGPFAAIDDLADVPGIGDATLEGLRALVTV